MREIFRDTNAAHAQLVAARLQDHGIHAVAAQSGLASIVGAGTFAVPCRVLVPEAEYEEAVAALALFAALEAPRPVEVRENCPACGAPWEPGFDECWNCSKTHDG